MQKISISQILSKNKRIIIILVLIALLLRLTVFTLTSSYIGHLNDQNIFEVITDYFVEGNDFYGSDIEQREDHLTATRIRAYPYGTVPTLIFAGLYGLGGKANFALLLRATSIIVDIVFLVLLFVSAIRLKRNAKLIGWLYALNPITILIVSFHGQLDVIVVFFAFLSWYVYKFSKGKQYISSSLLLGFSVAIKLFTVILWPLFLQKMRKGKKWVIFTVLVAAPFWLTLPLVFTKQNISQVLSQTIGYSGAGARNGFTFIFNTFAELTSWNLFIILEEIYREYGKFVMLIALALLWFTVTKRIQLIDGMALFFLTTYLFIPTLGVQYFVWFLPFYLLSSFFRLKPFLIQLGLISVTMGLFYFSHAVKIGVFSRWGITESLAPVFFQSYVYLIGVIWIGFIFLTISSFNIIKKSTFSSKDPSNI